MLGWDAELHIHRGFQNPPMKVGVIYLQAEEWAAVTKSLASGGAFSLFHLLQEQKSASQLPLWY